MCVRCLFTIRLLFSLEMCLFISLNRNRFLVDGPCPTNATTTTTTAHLNLLNLDRLQNL